MKRLAPYALATLATLAILVVLLKLWHLDLNVPLAYGFGDTLFTYMTVKGVVDHGWYLSNPHVGAPFGLAMQDFPMADGLHYALIKLFGLLIPSAGAAINLFFLATFVLTTLSAFYTLRHFKVSSPVALVFSLLYSFMPYHFWRGLAHLFLASYYMVPIAILLVLETWSDDPPLTRQGRFHWSARTAWTIAACLLIGSAGVYYAFFTCVLLGTAALSRAIARRSPKAMAPGLVLAGLIAVGVGVNLVPSLLFHHTYGANAEAVVRAPAQTEIYSLKLAQFVLPTPGHRLPSFRALTEAYQSFPLPNEGTEALGLIGTLGLISLLVRRLRISLGNDLSERLSILTLTSFLLGTIGGLGTLFTLFVSDSIRSYNRISIFIAFFCLFEVALLLDRWLQQVKRPAVRRLFGVGLPVLLAVGILDQTSPAFVPDYAASQAEYANDRRFVQQIESRLPAEAMVFQLPAVPFPETPPVERMGDYQLFRGYLHSRHLRWSYGAMKGRQNNWQVWIGAQPPDRLLPALAIAGFQGIYIDRLGLPENGKVLEAELRSRLGTAPIVSDNQRLAFFDLRDYARSYLRTAPASEVSAYRTVLAGLATEQPAPLQAQGAQSEFDRLYAAGMSYGRAHRPLTALDPAALVAARLVPAYEGSRGAGPDQHNWTPTGGWIGPWHEDHHFAVGINGRYAALAGIVAAHRAQAADVYFPYPRRLEGTPKPNDYGQLLLVFPVPDPGTAPH